MKKALAIDIISGLLILLFLYTAISKFTDYNSFKTVIHKSPLIANFSGTIAWALPLTEIIIACLLFVPFTKLTGLYTSAAILTIFTLYLIYMLMYTPKLPCSCGGVLKNMSWKQHVFFNTGFILLSLTGILLKKQLDRSINNSHSPNIQATM